MNALVHVFFCKGSEVGRLGQLPGGHLPFRRFSTRVCSFFGRWLILIASSSWFAFASATSRFLNASIFIADRSMKISSFFSNQTFVICRFYGRVNNQTAFGNTEA